MKFVIRNIFTQKLLLHLFYSKTIKYNAIKLVCSKIEIIYDSHDKIINIYIGNFEQFLSYN